MIHELTGPYRCFSNFWSCFIYFDGDWYPSVENAYQAAKMKNKSDRQRFLHIKASDAKKLGRTLPMRDDWNDIRLQVMYELVKQKFASGSLQHRLLETKDAEIQEGNWWGDDFWGTVNGVGENHLGKILMRVRSEFADEAKMRELMLP